MNYIINPAVFYWMDAINTLKIIVIIASLVLGCVCIVSAITTAIYGSDCNWNLDEDDDYKRMRKITIITAAATAACLILTVFIPSKSTMLEMMIAKYATYENAEWTVESLKSIVDYIVEAFKAVK